MAAGTYPGYSNSTYVAIVLKTGIGLYGGFAGKRDTAKSARSKPPSDDHRWKPGETIARHLSYLSDVSGTVVDGFTIQNCTGTVTYVPGGANVTFQGAITCASIGPNVVSNNLLINNDYGVYVYGKSPGPTVLDNRIVGNTKGGIVGYVTLAANNVIRGNSAARGAGIYAKGGT